jgi:hypothetical protein
MRMIDRCLGGSRCPARFFRWRPASASSTDRHIKFLTTPAVVIFIWPARHAE